MRTGFFLNSTQKEAVTTNFKPGDIVWAYHTRQVYSGHGKRTPRQKPVEGILATSLVQADQAYISKDPNMAFRKDMKPMFFMKLKNDMPDWKPIPLTDKLGIAATKQEAEEGFMAGLQAEIDEHQAEITRLQAERDKFSTKIKKG